MRKQSPSPCNPLPPLCLVLASSTRRIRPNCPPPAAIGRLFRPCLSAWRSKRRPHPCSFTQTSLDDTAAAELARARKAQASHSHYFRDGASSGPG